MRKTIQNVNVEFDTKMCRTMVCMLSVTEGELGGILKSWEEEEYSESQQGRTVQVTLLSYRARETLGNQFSLCSCILGRKGVFTLPKLLPIAAISFHRH